MISLRLRVALAFTVVFSLIVILFGVTLYLSASELEDTMVDQLLEGETSYIAERLRSDSHMIAPMSSNLKTWIVRNPAEARALPDHVRGLGPGQHEVFPGGEEVHVSVRDAYGARIYAAYDVSLNEQRLNRFKWLIALCVLAVVLVSLTVSYWLAGVLLKQVTELAHKVDRLAPGARGGTLTHDGQEAEVAQLARAFDNYQRRLEEALSREQEFTADASHELRTPLTAIRTSCELLAEDAGLSAKSRERVTRIDQAARRMGAQIESLLFLARELPARVGEPLNLAECVDDAVRSCGDEAVTRGVCIDIDVAREGSLVANREALHLALSNLLRNALRHTSNGSVRVVFKDEQLHVIDTGSGIAPEDLPHVFERFYRGAGAPDGATVGAGLGLAIVKRMCDLSGWAVSVSSAPGCGSDFCITFRAN